MKDLLNSPYARAAFIRGATETAVQMFWWRYPQRSGEEICCLMGDMLHGFFRENGVELSPDEWQEIGRVGGRKWLMLVGNSADIFSAQCAGVFADANAPQ